MIIYNKTWLDNLLLKADLEEKLKDGFISAEEFNQIVSRYPSGYRFTGFFARIGFAVLTLIILMFSSSVLSLFIFAFPVTFLIHFLPLLAGIGTYVILENFVKGQRHFKDGVTDMLLYFTAASLISFVYLQLQDNHLSTPIPLSIFTFLLCLYLTLRFTDAVMAIVSALSLFAAVFFLWGKLGAFGMATLPFIIMAAGACIYRAISKIQVMETAGYYANCVLVVKATALLIFYLAGNYFVVQQLGNRLNNLPADAKVPFGFIFWLLTAITPVGYLCIGVWKKDALLIRIGLLLAVVSVLTVHYYYHILPVEIALTIGGALLLGLVYAVVRYLKTAEHGITYQADGKTYFADNLNIESLLVSQTMGHTKAPAHQNDRFGGGSFGGGGSGSQF